MNKVYAQGIPGVLRRKISINIIPEIMSDYRLTEIFREVEYWSIRTVLMLGYKDVGRGKVYKSHIGSDTALKRVRHCMKLPGWKSTNISFDTVMVNKCKDLLDELRIPRRYYYDEEGKFSMYIDAVQNIMAPSSFADPSQHVQYNPFPFMTTDVQEAFDKW
jgi:hypothetical protein